MEAQGPFKKPFREHFSAGTFLNPMDRGPISLCHPIALLILAAVVRMAFSPPPASAENLSPQQAAAHIGENATVCGKVANTYYSCFISRKPTFINFGKPYPDHVFSLVITGEDRGAFGDCPEKLFTGREVCATGLIEEFDGKPPDGCQGSKPGALARQSVRQQLTPAGRTPQAPAISPAAV